MYVKHICYVAWAFYFIHLLSDTQSLWWNKTKIKDKLCSKYFCFFPVIFISVFYLSSSYTTQLSIRLPHESSVCATWIGVLRIPNMLRIFRRIFRGVYVKVFMCTLIKIFIEVCLKNVCEETFMRIHIQGQPFQFSWPFPSATESP